MQQAPQPIQTIVQSHAQQQQQQHSPGSNELKVNAPPSDDKSLFENDAGNMENETKSVSSMRSQDR